MFTIMSMHHFFNSGGYNLWLGAVKDSKGNWVWLSDGQKIPEKYSDTEYENWQQSATGKKMQFRYGKWNGCDSDSLWALCEKSVICLSGWIIEPKKAP
jgi:hypothetical protein